MDGIDIACIDLSTLQKNITMIPQDPMLFEGPLRYSLDPGLNYSDQAIWDALSHVRMAEFVRSLEGKLEAPMADGAANLSAGQRQLLCMARAILERPRLLVMDEATSNISGREDELLQQMLQNPDSFLAKCTVLTIAHRLDTLMWYDRVLVFHQGRLVESGAPAQLAALKSSRFAALLRQHNSSTEAANEEADASISPRRPEVDKISI